MAMRIANQAALIELNGPGNPKRIRSVKSNRKKGSLSEFDDTTSGKNFRSVSRYQVFKSEDSRHAGVVTIRLRITPGSDGPCWVTAAPAP